MGLKENIKSRRLELNMTLEDLALKVGTSRQTIQRYESGVIGNIPSDKIEKLAEALDTTPTNLMGWENDTSSTKLTRKDERDIEKILDDTRDKLLNQEGLMFDGDPASQESIDSIIAAMRIGMAMAKEKNKERFTPKKYRKD